MTISRDDLSIIMEAVRHELNPQFSMIADYFKRLDVHLDERFEQIDRRFQQVDLRFEQIDRRFQQVDLRFEQIDRRFEQVDLRFEKLERGMQGLAEDLSHWKLHVTGRFELSSTHQRITDQEQSRIEGRLTKLESRVEQIENKSAS